MTLPFASRLPSALRAAVLQSAGFGAAALLHACQAFGGHPGADVAAPDAGPDAAAYMDCFEGGICIPDPGSRPADCNVATGLETLPIITFDDVNTQTGFFKAENLYEYTDTTASSWFSNGTDLCPGSDVRIPMPLASTPGSSAPLPGPASCGFEPWTERADLCRSGDYALHLVGGPFLGWGGGVGISMQKLNGRDKQDGDANKALCTKGAPNPVCPPADAEYAVSVAALDVSHYDGVSFWARRGPRSQPGLRLNVGDKHTDDDLNYLANRHAALTGVPEPLYCARVKECGCSYQGPCTYYDSENQYWCRDPKDPKTRAQCGGGGLTNSTISISGLSTNCKCGAADVCNTNYAAFPNDAPIGPDGQPITAIDPVSGNPVFADTAFYGRVCTPYSFPDGSGTSFCFTPGSDPPPAPGSERCGDHWVKSVNLGPDWQFFRIPFSDLLQQGFAKKAEVLDLHSVSVVRFTWDAGYIDYWIDEVSFYKNPE